MCGVALLPRTPSTAGVITVQENGIRKQLDSAHDPLEAPVVAGEMATYESDARAWESDEYLERLADQGKDRTNVRRAGPVA